VSRIAKPLDKFKRVAISQHDMTAPKITITLDSVGPNDLTHTITLDDEHERYEPLIKIIGPPMVGKSSILRAIRHGLTGTHDLTDAGFRKWLDGGTIKAKPEGITLGSIVVGPRGFGPRRIDFTGPRKAVETALRHAPIEVFDPDGRMEPTEAKSVFKSAIDLAFGRRQSLEGEIETKREIRRHLIAGGVSTADVDREIAALTEREAEAQDQIAKAKAVVKAAWARCDEWIRSRGLLDLRVSGCYGLNPAVEHDNLSATGTLKATFDTVWGDAEDRTLSTASAGARASFELTWFTRLVDALDVPAVLLLDDVELQGWSGEILEQNIRSLVLWAKTRDQPAWVVVARQTDPVPLKGLTIATGRETA